MAMREAMCLEHASVAWGFGGDDMQPQVPASVRLCCSRVEMLSRDVQAGDDGLKSVELKLGNSSIWVHAHLLACIC